MEKQDNILLFPFIGPLSNCNKEIISFLDTEIKQLNLTKIPLNELENLKEIIINFNIEALTIKLDNKIKETAISYYENNLTKNAILLFELISKDKSVDKYINEISEKLLSVSEKNLIVPTVIITVNTIVINIFPPLLSLLLE